jgi:hypothetical protein
LKEVAEPAELAKQVRPARLAKIRGRGGRRGKKRRNRAFSLGKRGFVRRRSFDVKPKNRRELSSTD